MITANYHTHTHRCKHAEGDIADYCRAAVANGITHLGFSDHTPLPDGRWQSVRMEMNQLADYRAAIQHARKAFPDLRIFAGLECEYIPEFTSFYQDILLGEHDLDYLVGGAHWYPYNSHWNSMYGRPMDGRMLRAYADYQVEAIHSGLFAFIAHPDLLGVAYFVWDSEARACSRAILEASAASGVPVEINGYGFRKPMIDTPEGPRLKYPWLPFWELAAECGAPVVINSDAHLPRDVAANLDDAEAIARRFGLVRVQDPLARVTA